jgi:hypothetical protein
MLNFVVSQKIIDEVFMSFYGSVGAAAIGAGMIAYGGYKYATANEGASEQKQLALKSLKIGAAVFALGAFFLYGNDFSSNAAVKPQMPVKVLPVCHNHMSGKSAVSLLNEIFGCPNEDLREILNGADSNSLVAKTFKTLADTQGLSCNNYLPWSDNYQGFTDYIDRIRPDDLKEPVMWGIDPCGRLFIAVRYVCDQTKEGAVAFFQKGAGCNDRIAVGGHFQPEGCWNLGSLNPYGAEFLSSLREFFQGGEIKAPLYDRVSVLTLAK